MKWVLSSAALLLAFNVHAADKKLGNVIAVQRTIDKVYDSCMEQVSKDKNNTPDQRYFFCTFPATNSDLESVPGSQHLLFSNDAHCTVDVSVQGAKVLVTFNGNDAKADLAVAKSCLQASLNDPKVNDSFTFIVYAVE